MKELKQNIINILFTRVTHEILNYAGFVLIGCKLDVLNII